MKKKYVVQQYFYDSGRVKVVPPVKTSDERLTSVEERRTHDYCRDVFDTLEEAERFYYECLYVYCGREKRNRGCGMR